MGEGILNRNYPLGERYQTPEPELTLCFESQKSLRVAISLPHRGDLVSNCVAIRDVGCSDILAKPFSVPNFLENVAKYLGDPA